MKVGYYAYVTEHEWGFRPDGILLGLNKEAMIARGKQEKGHLAHWPQGFSDIGDIRMCVLNSHYAERLEEAEDGLLWVSGNNIEDYTDQV